MTAPLPSHEPPTSAPRRSAAPITTLLVMREEAAALLRSRGATVFEENIFENRYRHVDELSRMGGLIRVSGRVAVVTGTEKLYGAPVRCTDLRGGAALCVAALAAEGESAISEIGHIDRGYESIERDLTDLGGEIRRIKTEREQE